MTMSMPSQSRASKVGLCAQMKALQAALVNNPAMVFNLAKCAESEGRLADAASLLTKYIETAPMAADLDEVRARLAVLNSLSALPDPQGIAGANAPMRTPRSTYRQRSYDQAIADYQKADEAMPEFTESKRRLAILLQRSGAGRSGPGLLATGHPRRSDRREQTADAAPHRLARRREGAIRRTRRRSATDPARSRWGAASSRENRSAECMRRTGYSSPTRRFESAASLFPLASEVNLLQAFTCSQMNDFRCVRASFDAQRSLTRPVSFYAAVFYSVPEPNSRREATPDVREIRVRERHGAVCRNLNREPQEAVAQPSALGAGEDRLGHLGAADGLRSAKFQGFTVPATAIKHLENKDGLLYLEVDDRRIKRRHMLIEPLSLALAVPPTGPGARRHLNNYINIAEKYGDVEKAKLGKESTTAGEKLKMVYNIATHWARRHLGDVWQLLRRSSTSPRAWPGWVATSRSINGKCSGWPGSSGKPSVESRSRRSPPNRPAWRSVGT